MAKYSVNYICGHTGSVELVGKVADRNSKIEWMERECVCPACYAKQQQEKLIADGGQIVRMHYAEYKNYYADCKTVSGSYNAAEKTVEVMVTLRDQLIADIARTATEEQSAKYGRYEFAKLLVGRCEPRAARGKRIVFKGGEEAKKLEDMMNNYFFPA